MSGFEWFVIGCLFATMLWFPYVMWRESKSRSNSSGQVRAQDNAQPKPQRRCPNCGSFNINLRTLRCIICDHYSLDAPLPNQQQPPEVRTPDTEGNGG